MEFQKTTAQSKIAKLRKRVRVVRGGTSSSKTFSIIPLLIDYAIKNPKTEISIVAETIPHLKRGAMRDFLKIMDMINMFDASKWNKSSLTYTFSNKSYIEFFSAEQPQKLRGARRDVLFVNECNNISWEAYYQLAIRTRRFIYLDYNPVAEFWVDTEVLKDKDAEMIVLTYKDNEALDKSIVQEIEKAREKAKTSSYWANWWRVYGLGEIGVQVDAVFQNYEIIDTSNIGIEHIVGFGLDFGFTDPNALVAMYKFEGKIIFEEWLYKSGLSIQEMRIDMMNLIKSKGYNPNVFWGNTILICDSSAPTYITELRQNGFYRAYECYKHLGAKQIAINELNSNGFYVSSKSKNLIHELRKYTYLRDKENRLTNITTERDDHLLDAMRYVYFHFNK